MQSPTSNYSLELVIQDKIADLKSNIRQHRGVSVYQDLCQKWQHYVEAYELLLLDIAVNVAT